MSMIRVVFAAPEKEKIWETDYIMNCILPDMPKEEIFIPFEQIVNGNILADVFVYNCRLHSYEDVLSVVQQMKPKIIFHLSDEYWFENLSQWNELSNYCDLFLRQHHHPGFTYTDNTIQIPLGYCNDAGVEGKHIPNISERKYNWSFIGDMKTDRWEMVDAFSIIKKNFIGSGISKPEMMDVYLDSIFVLSGRGNSSINCFRLYEASMAGAIPVVVGSQDEIDLTFMYEENPPWIFVDTWENAVKECKRLLRNKKRLQDIQSRILLWWKTRIGRIRDKMYQVFVEKNISVIQVGSNKGSDDLYRHLVSNYSSLNFGLFVEANPTHIPELMECYKCFDNVIIKNIAIKSPNQTEDSLTIFYDTNDPGLQVASCDINHVLKHQHCWPGGEIKSFQIPAITLEELLDSYNIEKLDWLLLDIEGIDAEIILTFNWSKYQIKRIEFEHLHLGEYASQIHQMFLNMGYEQVPSLHEYDWAFEIRDRIKIPHIYQQTRFGEEWFGYQTVYSNMVKRFDSGSRFVEVGCWKGKSTSYMAVEIANSGKNIDFFCVDNWVDREVHEIFTSNMSNLTDYYIPIKCNSLDAANKFDDGSLDFVFLDASLNYAGVKNDIHSWIPKIKPGGILAGHDYYVDGVNWFPEVKDAVDELLDHVDSIENCFIHYKPDSNKLNNFPPVHFISVDDSIERRELLLHKFEKFGITNVTPHIYKRYKDEDHVIESDLLHRLSIGSRGPVTSHLKAIREWYENTNEEVAFFCEDDLSLETVKYWNFTWQDFYENLPKDWGCIQLAWLREGDDYYRFSIGFRNRCWCDWSGCAYLITREHARLLVENYYYDDAFHLNLVGEGADQREEWARVPVIETIIFSPVTKVYGIPLFVEDVIECKSSYLGLVGNQVGGQCDVHHMQSYLNTKYWWQTTGQLYKFDKLIVP